MSIETPQFKLLNEADQCFVLAERHTERPAVLFAMLGLTALRDYNTVSPKEENLYLGETDAVDKRLVVSELPDDVASGRMNAVLRQFSATCEDYRNVSERQLRALFDYARNRDSLDNLL